MCLQSSSLNVLVHKKIASLCLQASQKSARQREGSGDAWCLNARNAEVADLGGHTRDDDNRKCLGQT
jgi:hypothetical protein